LALSNKKKMQSRLVGAWGSQAMGLAFTYVHSCMPLLSHTHLSAHLLTCNLIDIHARVQIVHL
jgi:hypothetical protein